jgi:hypothetical protein
MAEKSRKSSGASTQPKTQPSPWVDPDDAPEWTEEMLDRAEVRDGDKVIRPGRSPLPDPAKGD